MCKPIAAKSTLPVKDETETGTINTTNGSSKNCGRPTYYPILNLNKKNRIVGGWEVRPNSLPWIVLIKQRLSKRHVRICGGSLIALPFANSSNLVLTAAHCLLRKDMEYNTPEAIRVIVGNHNYQDSQKTIIRVAKYIAHDFLHGEKKNDVAVLRLSRSVDFNDKIQPICLPETADEMPDKQVKCFIAGWGITNDISKNTKLRMVSVKIHQSVFCDNENYENETFCAGNLAGNKDACKGDSGGPLFCERDDHFVQYGIISLGKVPCGLPFHLTLYTRIGYYKKWIVDAAVNMTNVQKDRNRKQAKSVMLSKRKLINTTMETRPNDDLTNTSSALLAAFNKIDE
ncbi:Plasminogen [Trichinella pseudospiralis]|uniref:Plasminogen n=2 Tax=Trichinella pseudospiralis TaxID=6337 RepID=A0A0V1FCM6_TRIPS|nr:Plasminogen [Trichinella pseudospiralis]KRZ23191.1 Plasminogen [Trichinella pseudospiralis]KRZ35521.1 Plasminogen [Trichinella pseudospiralis]